MDFVKVCAVGLIYLA